MTNTPPDFLYKYRSLTTEEDRKFTGQIFNDTELYFAKPPQFNDPFDCLPSFDWIATKAETKKYVKKHFGRKHTYLPRNEKRLKYNQLLAGFDGTRKDPVLRNNTETAILANIHKSNVFCVSEDPTNILMWSHYAQNHTGICLKFDARPKTNLGLTALPIKYQDERPRVNPIRDSDLEKYRKLLLYKSKVWRYEKEWRVITGSDSPQVVKYPGKELVGVILGAKINEENEQIVLNWVKEFVHSLEVQRAVMSEEKYALELVKCSD